ncbi:DUF7519 family protein [Haloarcula onubensis]|uniref:Uncharacterized protein n=1 Tax=Haloarcula onubensis TaxID=2950539 RepID=A0ABU2FJQ6_9EURY|nr:hypothetical protein [Halomicroarcula sp. S3CR25-11]MDS0280996.1 hypothetical protein [Halomicroarcula sp. S3CR25-11]
MTGVRPVGVAAVVAALLSGVVAATTLAAPVALLGVGLVAVGTVRAARRAVTAGAVTLAVAVLVAGVVGTGPLALLVATAAAVLAWDFGHYAVALDHGLADEAVTRNAELVRVAGGTLVGAAAVGGLSLSTLAVAVPAVDTLTAGLLFVGSVLAVYGLR